MLVVLNRPDSRFFSSNDTHPSRGEGRLSAANLSLAANRRHFFGVHARKLAFPENLTLSQIAGLAKICGLNHLPTHQSTDNCKNARSQIRY